jgi:uncharacterized protein YjeT (DUF2065 family)
VGIILLAVLLVLILAGVGVRFGSPGTWEKGVQGINQTFDGTMLNLFKKLSTEYVNDASDMDGEEKRAWTERLNKTATVLQEEKGTATCRRELRDEYEGIVDKMEDGDLTKAELAPFQKKLDRLLEQIETEEAQKKE